MSYGRSPNSLLSGIPVRMDRNVVFKPCTNYLPPCIACHFVNPLANHNAFLQNLFDLIGPDGVKDEAFVGEQDTGRIAKGDAAHFVTSIIEDGTLRCQVTAVEREAGGGFAGVPFVDGVGKPCASGQTRVATAGHTA